MHDEEQIKKDMLERIPKLISLLEKQGYFLETETTICLGVDVIVSVVEDLLAEQGYKIISTATDVHDGSFMYGCFLKDHFEPEDWQKIIRDDYKKRYPEDE